MRPQRIDLITGERKHEVVWEAIEVAADLLVEPFRRNALELGEILVKHHLPFSDEIDAFLDKFSWDGDGGFLFFLRHIFCSGVYFSISSRDIPRMDEIAFVQPPSPNRKNSSSGSRRCA